MIPVNGAPYDLEARDVLRSLPFAQRRARDDSNRTPLIGRMDIWALCLTCPN
jgi:hypothetical protein